MLPMPLEGEDLHPLGALMAEHSEKGACAPYDRHRGK